MFCFRCNAHSESMCRRSDCPYVHSNNKSARIPSYAMQPGEGVRILEKLLGLVKVRKAMVSDLVMKKATEGTILDIGVFVPNSVALNLEEEIKKIENYIEAS